ncbi:MAG TPA: FAD-dependent oxidoreductase [Gammaproteobacteria bacterium]|nr:FAD-dependent oxidoreductase [Gammaproteobacteria bacterium]
MRIAIVGTGVAGLTVAHRLHRQHDITLFEAEPRPGGHVHTVSVDGPEGGRSVDTGFIVFNDWTYPNFCALLEELGVPSQTTSMSFSVRREDTGLEYNGTSLNALFAQRRNLVSPRFLSMVRGILRFNREGPRLLASDDDGTTLGDYLDSNRYGTAFREDYLLPMGSAIWSAPPARTAEMPARYFVEFFHNHGMLSVGRRPQWRVVEGGSARYVEALLRQFTGQLRLGCKVLRVSRLPNGVHLESVGVGAEIFDAVVFACHSDQALSLLSDPTLAEQEVLGAIRYQSNDVVLHTDEALLPRRRRAWAAWNYRRDGSDADAPVNVTYNMNILQGFADRTQYLVTLNDRSRVNPGKVITRLTYDHPCYDRPAIAAQWRWDDVNGVCRTWFCGAWWGWGFHEDGVVSGLRVARALAN